MCVHAGVWQAQPRPEERRDETRHIHKHLKMASSVIDANHKVLLHGMTDQSLGSGNFPAHVTSPTAFACPRRVGGVSRAQPLFRFTLAAAASGNPSSRLEQCNVHHFHASSPYKTPSSQAPSGFCSSRLLFCSPASLCRLLRSPTSFVSIHFNTASGSVHIPYCRLILTGQTIQWLLSAPFSSPP